MRKVNSRDTNGRDIKMEFTGDNEVDVCNASDEEYLKRLQNKFPKEYEWLIGFIIPIINWNRKLSYLEGLKNREKVRLENELLNKINDHFKKDTILTGIDWIEMQK